jgi:hypothetical protein
LRRAARRFQRLEWAVALDPEGILKAGIEGSHCRKAKRQVSADVG